MNLSPAIQAFFDAEKDADATAAPIEAFAPEAIVRDEGKTYVGRNAIETWWRSAKAQFQHKSEPVSTVEENGLTKVQARVSGNFPNSPAMLTFACQIKSGKIAALEIGV